MKNFKFIGLSLSCIFLLVSGVYAEDLKDSVDTSFGTNGKVLEILYASGKTRHKAVLVQDDDKIIASGIARNDAEDDVLALYRYLPDGSRDLSFGVGGASYTDHVCQGDSCSGISFATGLEDVGGMILQSDGKIVIARTDSEGPDGYNHDSYFGVVRFDANGTLDTTFGYGGYGYNSSVDSTRITDAAVQSDDKILAVGSGFIGHWSLLLGRFNANGSTDTTFGNGGYIYFDSSPSDSYSADDGNGIAVQADGKFLVAGTTHIKGCGDDADGIYTRGLLLRYNDDGTLDDTFDGDGILKFTAASVFDVRPYNSSETYPCDGSVFQDVAVQADGKIVVLGTGSSATYEMFLARFNPNGTLDTTFGYQGVRTLYDEYQYTEFDHLNTVFTYTDRSISIGIVDHPGRILLQKNGGIVVSGSITYGGNYNGRFLALHFTKDGDFDTRYGVEGDASVDVNYPDDFLYRGVHAYDVAEQSNGKVILAGFAYGFDTPSHAVLTRTKSLENKVNPAILMYLLQ